MSDHIRGLVSRPLSHSKVTCDTNLFYERDLRSLVPTYIRRILPACGGMCLLAIPNMYISLVMCQTKGTPPWGSTWRKY